MSKTTLPILFLIILLASCAPMTPIQLNNTLPKLTKSKFHSQIQAEEVIKNNDCTYLVKDRNYVAAMGLSAKDDLKDGARGIDQWVSLDKGNAYVLKNYEWVVVDHYGSSQLRLEFDTLLCK